MWKLMLSFFALGSLFVGTAHAETLWRCTQPDGGTVFTNRTTDSVRDCQKYILESDMIQGPRVKPDARSAETKLTVEPRLSDQPVTGQIDFSTFNRLSVGMTEAAVVSLAGPPKAKFSSAWVYSMADDRTVELQIGGGAIVAIRQYQSRR